MWERYDFKPGDRVARADGAWSEVLSADGGALRVRYTGEGGDPSLAGTEGALDADHVISVSPGPPAPAWGDRVGVVVHRVPESPEGEAGYGAVTTTGVPLGVSVEAHDADSAPEALDRLLGALKTFGFAGTVAVEDATYVGRVERYDLEIS